MSEILKTSRIYIIMLAVALILSQFITLGCCDSDADISSINTGSIDTNTDNYNLDTLTDSNSLTPATDSIWSVGSFDKHSVASFSNGAMGLSNDLETYLTPQEDGSILKSRKISMISFGSELMTVGDLSSFTGSDSLGNEFGTGSESLITLKNCAFPFAVVRQDLTKLSSDGINIDDINSKTFLLLPDVYTADEAAMLGDVFGKGSITDIEMFKSSADMKSIFNDAGFDLTKYFSMKDLGAFMGMFDNSDIWEMFRKGAQDRLDAEADKEPDRTFGNYRASSGGVTCTWGYKM